MRSINLLSLAALFFLAVGCSRELPAPAPGSSAASAGAASPTPPASGGVISAPVDTETQPIIPATSASEPEKPRLASIGNTTWIYADRLGRRRIGHVRPGTTIPLRGEDAVKALGGAVGCKSMRFYEVEPHGFVCDDETVTRDIQSPAFRALVYAGPREGARPFEYAFSTRAPMYGRIPDEKDQARAEKRLRKVQELARLPRSNDGHQDLAELSPPPPRDSIPDFLLGGQEAPALLGRGGGGLVRKEIPYGSMLSWGRSFTAGGRTYLLSPDLTLIPADRVRPFRHTTFHGAVIDATNPLPLGWFRKKPRPKFRRSAEGAFVDTGERWAPRTFVSLTGRTEEHGREVYWETREPGPLYARAADISVVREPKEWPSRVEPDEKWIEVSLGRGTMTLFEARKAVYSTLMSPGAGGVTQSAKLSTEELVRGAFTPLGSYRIAVKYRAAQLTDEATPDPSSFWIADVPWVQYFRNPFAIHTAFWHEDFGERKSGGCINLSPEDARFVFEWTSPRVPDGWASAEATNEEPGTWVVIRK